MMKSEFEAMVKVQLTPEEYDRIETIYMYHPLMGPDSKAKEKILEFYRAGLIPDLYPRANAIRVWRDTISDLEKSRKESKERMNKIVREAEEEYTTHLWTLDQECAHAYGIIDDLERSVV